ncbi:MAG: hydroxymethylglutaryl-CoA reductase, degradative [Candidatus Micrarchaeota archaeon]
MDEKKWSGFYKLSVDERRKKVVEELGLSSDEEALLKKSGALSIELADKMSENVIGTAGLPLAIAPNFVVDGKAVVVPMAIEEPSVVAAASYAAKLAAKNGGFSCTYTGSLMVGQVQIVGMRDAQAAKEKIEGMREELAGEADKFAAHLHPYGGGVKECSARIVNTDRGKMLVVEFLVGVSDAMGANAVNTIMEAIAPRLEEICVGKARLKILTNLATQRMAGARAVWKKEDCGGDEGIESILDCWSFAMADPYRRATHNKGIMNGIDAVLVACGNDWRAVEAGAHSYAAMKQGALTTFRKTIDGDLEGKILLPMAVGTIGGSLRVNPVARMCLKILGAKNSEEFARVLASVGLAQNFAALRALALEGIQKGHMRLHARNLAAAAGAKPGEIERVVAIMEGEKALNESGAAEALKKVRGK